MRNDEAQFRQVNGRPDGIRSGCACNLQHKNEDASPFMGTGVVLANEPPVTKSDIWRER